LSLRDRQELMRVAGMVLLAIATPAFLLFLEHKGRKGWIAKLNNIRAGITNAFILRLFLTKWALIHLKTLLSYMRSD